MPKIKKSDLRYGDVIKFAESYNFGSKEHFLHGKLAGFTEDTFLVDVLPPSRGKKLPQYETRAASAPDKFCQLKKWVAFEVVSRLPDEVQVFKTRMKNFGGPVHFRNITLGRDGTSWDDKAVAAQQAMQAARELGCAAVVFRSFGYAEVYPWPEGVPSLEWLQKEVNDPWETIAAMYDHELGDNGYLVYSGDNALAVDKVVMNETAQFALLNDPTLREMQDYINTPEGYVENPLKLRAIAPGNVVVLVGFSICDQTGDTIRTPIQQKEEVAA